MLFYTSIHFRFFQYTELFVTAIGAFLLFAIWKNIRNRFKQKLEEDEGQRRIDKGLLYISLALIVWVIKGVILLALPSMSVMIAHGIEVLFSLLNSLFFILALFYFDHAPDFLYHNRENVKRIIQSFVFISILSLLLFFMLDAHSDSFFRYSSIPDIIISAILAYFLIYSFYHTFRERKLKLIAYFSLVTLIAMFVAQLPEILPNLDQQLVDLIRIISKSALISLCLVLATTWVIDLAETPLPSEMQIYFKDWSLLELSIPSKSIDRVTVDFKGKHTQFRNLLKFAVRRRFGKGDEHYIEVVRGGEISEQVYLTRIIHDINACLESQKADRKDLFTFIGHGKYRLRFVPDNIKIDDALLNEFVNNPEHETYKGIIKNIL